VACPILADVWENLAPSQADKITASTTSRHGEVRWDYPDTRDGAGLEVSRALVLNTRSGTWSKTRNAWTARVDAGPLSSPIAVSAAGAVVWDERGQSADGAALSWSLETNDFALGEGDAVMLVREVWPDVHDQQGAVTLTLYTRMDPQGPETSTSHTLSAGEAQAFPLAAGRIARWRLSGSSTPAAGRIGRFSFDVAEQGRR
jgi:hypothetical protein